MANELQGALASKFKDVLPALENIPVKHQNKKKVVKNNMAGMCHNIRAVAMVSPAHHHYEDGVKRLAVWTCGTRGGDA